MKIGKIENGSLGPTITCNFHDAKFSLVNGQCKAWCSNVGMVDRMKPSGKENSPATVYPCAVEKGKVVVTL
jgi:nitrite reductase/ring-hydroxylating ferredoxin subunit